MSLGLIGYKVGMTQVFNADGSIEPVTVIQVGPCPVLQIRTKDKDGYAAVQLGFQDKPRKNATRAERGHVATSLESKRKESRLKAGVQLPAKADCEPQRVVREFRVDATSVTIGQKLGVADVFPDTVKAVDVIGTSKGRGYQGVMKRHNFDGLPAAHGAKKVHRQAGSTSSLASNRGSGRPKKGLKRAGQYGNTRVTIRNLKVVRVDAANNLIMVRGAVPGHNNAVVMVRPTNVYGSVHGKVAPEAPTKTKVVIQKGKK
ncbi:50S ribosomal protein L3 [Fimbriiglobus ruber]|uniref:Large ribosomal subunit protein uL3 n=1 Tax=Fimbriiglobus ruber TaxID=1908690 RepID=A0A225D8B2_9BACT|nr:50S ribosomal protein L3 [Fimbriiglobus ruber]OWK35874.1 LSU ribosomal protein L3p (L3e) [Fimbriiglobus ruber]